jgi:hypothetical protein
MAELGELPNISLENYLYISIVMDSSYSVHSFLNRKEERSIRRAHSDVVPR